MALANSIDVEASTLYRAYSPNTGEHLYSATRFAISAEAQKSRIYLPIL